jgi:spermidine/putrescine transport system permease protein
VIRLNRLLAIPALFWFSFFVAIPLVIVLAVSFISRDNYGTLQWVWTFDNYIRVFSSSYLLILLESLKLALLTTFGCLVLGLPLAWAMATAGSKWRQFFLLMMTLPFLTNLVIRIYAIRVFVGYDGPLQTVLTWLHISFDPFTLSQNESLVFYGMLTTYLPFMVLPLYSAFEKFDFSLVEAAQDLGAGNWRILTKVIAPNLRRALVSGSLLVFIPALGEYVIPDLLGGAKTLLYGNLITHQFLKARDWPFGSALSILLMVVLFIFVWLFMKAFEARRD